MRKRNEKEIQKEKIVDRDIQRKRLIIEVPRVITDDTLKRPMIEFKEIRNVVELQPEKVTKIRKRRLIV